MSGVDQTTDQVGSRFRTVSTVLRRFPVIPVLIILIIVLAGIFADFVAPYSPYEISLPDKLKPPGWVEGGSMQHPLGTDLLGRDILSRLIFGARISLLVAVMGILVAGSVGTVLGIVAGHYGGWVDSVIMRMVDATLSLPIILIALLLAVVLGPSFANLIYVMGLVLWARYSRVVRGEVLSLKSLDFISYARVAGASNIKIMTRHLFPNILNSLMVLITYQTGFVILLEAGLSFLGAGVPPPTPSWGGMVAIGRNYVSSAWWLCVFPGLAIMLTVLAINLFGDWLRDFLDPKLRQI